MEAEIVLLFGVIVLACGSLALLIVRLFSPNLLGTSWLAVAFAAGACGAGLLLVVGHPVLSILGADLALLSSFVLLHIAVLRVAKSPLTHLWHAGVLLAAQAFTDTLRLAHLTTGRTRIVTIGLLVAMQSATTARVLLKLAKDSVRPPAIFSAVIMLGFGLFNLVRSGFEAFGQGNGALSFQLAFVAFSLFIAVALGLAFGFFWMTTATLTAEAEHMASTDPLTRLYNRRTFLRWCEKELLRSQRTNLPFSLLMVDLDHFKRVNDRFGHQTGDLVLCAAVERMQDSIRGLDVLCRWGGEEFAVLLPNATLDATTIVAERIRENIQKVTLSGLNVLSDVRGDLREAFQLTVSIGTATYRSQEDDVAGMLLRADRALYAAKNAGRNRVLVAS